MFNAPARSTDQFLTMILHTVNRSPFQQTTLAQCIQRCADSDAIILLENGVYGALQHSPQANQLSTIDCFAIKADVQARGLSDKSLIKEIELIDFEHFVALTCRYSLVMSWY